MLEETFVYLTEFSRKWKNALLPQIREMLAGHSPTDVTSAFEKTNCRLIKEGIGAGNRVYAITFKNCKGLVEKWMFDEEGARLRNPDGAPIIETNHSTVAMSVVDMVSEFINSDEVLSVRSNRERAYNLKREDVIDAMRACGANPDEDTTFFFVKKEDEIKATTTIFLDSLRYILEEGIESRSRNIIGMDQVVPVEYPHEALGVITNNFLYGTMSHEVSSRRSAKRIAGG